MQGSHIRTLFFLPLFLSCILAFAQADTEKASEIMIQGKITGENLPLSSASIIICPDGETSKAIVSGSEGEFTFWLSPEKEYLVFFSKQGYVPKRIFFNTRGIPENMFITRSGILVDLFRETKDIDFSVLNNPIGMFYFYPEKNIFDYDKQYTDSIEKLLIEIKKQVYQLPVIFPDSTAKSEPISNQPEAKVLWEQNDSLRKSRNKINEAAAGTAPVNNSSKQIESVKGVKPDRKTREVKANTSKQVMLEKMRAETKKREEADSLKKAGIKARLKEQNQAKSEVIVDLNNVEDEDLAKKLFNEKMSNEERAQYEAMLIKKYPAGITREEKRYKHFMLIRIIKIYNGKVDEFKKIIYSYGSYFKKNGNDITLEVFDLETENIENRQKNNK